MSLDGMGLPKSTIHPRPTTYNLASESSLDFEIELSRVNHVSRCVIGVFLVLAVGHQKCSGVDP